MPATHSTVLQLLTVIFNEYLANCWSVPPFASLLSRGQRLTIDRFWQYLPTAFPRRLDSFRRRWTALNRDILDRHSLAARDEQVMGGSDPGDICIYREVARQMHSAPEKAIDFEEVRVDRPVQGSLLLRFS